MTKRERVKASISRTALDAIPWQFDLTKSVIWKLKKFYGTNEISSILDDHFMMVQMKTPLEVVQPDDADLVRDELGSVWRRASRDTAIGDWGELVDYPIRQPSLQGYSFPTGSRVGRWEHVDQIREKFPDLFLTAIGMGLFENGWFLCGFENYLGYVAGEPAFVQELTEGLVEYSCAVTRQLAGLGFDAIRFGDDWGFQDHLMLQPDLWRTTYKRHYARIYGAARDIGLIVCIHSCGNITDILPDLIDIGVQVVHPLQPEAMDVRKCKREFGKSLAFWGGLGSQSTLPLGSPAEVRLEVRSRISLFSDGGYILAPAGAAPAETPAENIHAIIEEAKAQMK